MNTIASGHSKHNLIAEACGFPTRLTLVFSDTSHVSEFEQKSLFIQELLNHGIICNGGAMVCYEHSDDDIELVTKVIYQAVKKVAKHISGERT